MKDSYIGRISSALHESNIFMVFAKVWHQYVWKSKIHLAQKSCIILHCYELRKESAKTTLNIISYLISTLILGRKCIYSQLSHCTKKSGRFLEKKKQMWRWKRSSFKAMGLWGFHSPGSPMMQYVGLTLGGCPFTGLCHFGLSKFVMVDVWCGKNWCFTAVKWPFSYYVEFTSAMNEVAVASNFMAVCTWWST